MQLFQRTKAAAKTSMHLQQRQKRSADGLDENSLTGNHNHHKATTQSPPSATNQSDDHKRSPIRSLSFSSLRSLSLEGGPSCAVLLHKRTVWQAAASMLLLVALFMAFLARWSPENYDYTTAAVTETFKMTSSSTMTMYGKEEEEDDASDQFNKQAQNKNHELPRLVFDDVNRPRDARVNDDMRPVFVLHIGPPKTATTSFQYALTHYKTKGILERDGYSYLGQVMLDETNMWRHLHGDILSILKERRCISRVEQYRGRLDALRQEWQEEDQARFHRSVHDPSSPNYQPEPDCWARLRHLLQEHVDRNESIIMSEENFAIKYVHLPTTSDSRLDSLNWQYLAELLDEVGFRPLILIGYRRLFDILPSAKQQWDRWTKTQKSLNEWPHLAGETNDGNPATRVGRMLQPLFPDVLNDTRLGDNYVPRRIPGVISWSYTDYLVKVISPHLPVRLLHIHDSSKSVRTTFLCHVLPFAPASCAQSRADDLTDAPEHYNPEESLFYDRLTCEAAQRGWLPDDERLYFRHNITLVTRAYYENKLGKSAKDLPITCPPREQSDVLLERSLAKEAQLWPAELAAAWRDEHIRAYEETIRRNKYCWIDVNRTFETQPHWYNFFSSLQPPTPKEAREYRLQLQKRPNKAIQQEQRAARHHGGGDQELPRRGRDGRPAIPREGDDAEDMMQLRAQRQALLRQHREKQQQRFQQRQQIYQQRQQLQQQQRPWQN